MRCDEAQGFVSSMYDGEMVPRKAAEHIAHCDKCQELLRSFADMGAKVRSFGMLQISEPVPERTWVQPRRRITYWWGKGWQMMRVPRIVFALLAVVLVILGSRLALVEVKTHEEGSVLMLKLATQNDQMLCAVSAVDEKGKSCGGLAQLAGGTLVYNIAFVRKEGDRVLLSVVSDYPSHLHSFGPDTAKSLPETQHWFTPGETVPLMNTEAIKLSMTGQWMDHMPVSLMQNQSLDPAADEFRVDSPLMLRDGSMVGDLKGLGAVADEPGEGIKVYLPGEGMFSFSLTPISDAVPGKVDSNRISFIEAGKSYQLIASMPIARAEKVWVLHDPNYKSSGNEADRPVMGAGPIISDRPVSGTASVNVRQ